MIDREREHSTGTRSRRPGRVPLIMAGLTTCAMLLAISGTIPGAGPIARAQGMSSTPVQVDVAVQQSMIRRNNAGSETPYLELNTAYHQGALYELLVAGAVVQMFRGSEFVQAAMAASKSQNPVEALAQLNLPPDIDVSRADGVRHWDLTRDHPPRGRGVVALSGADLSKVDRESGRHPVGIVRCPQDLSRGLVFYKPPDVKVRDPGGPTDLWKAKSETLAGHGLPGGYDEVLARARAACPGYDARSYQNGLFIGTFSWADLDAGKRIDVAADYETSPSATKPSKWSWDNRIHVAVTLEAQVADLELIVTSKAYDTWRPEARENESAIGNEITLDAKLQSPGGGAATVKARKIIFELTDTSREPGVALNFPLAAATPGDFDLQFSPKTNPPGPYIISGTGNQRAETAAGQYTSASIVVSSFDWGAWSTLKVTAELEDGRRVTGHFKSKSGPADILLPKRGKDSKIADSWKQDAGVSLPDDDDSEIGPAGDGSAGDGFSLYEEYRGFYVNGGHIAGDPKKIDFFVRNYIGVDADLGIFLFADLTGAEVHSKLLDTEFDRNVRVMNANRDRGPHHDSPSAATFEQIQGQHGVFLETQAGLDGGKTVLSEAGVRGRPVITQSVNLQPRDSLTGMTTSENVPFSDLAFAYDRAVAHELLHSVGAEHHGEGDGTATFYFHFGDDPQNAIGKSYFSFSRQLAGETIFGMHATTGSAGSEDDRRRSHGTRPGEHDGRRHDAGTRAHAARQLPGHAEGGEEIPGRPPGLQHPVDGRAAGGTRPGLARLRPVCALAVHRSRARRMFRRRALRDAVLLRQDLRKEEHEERLLRHQRQPYRARGPRALPAADRDRHQRRNAQAAGPVRRRRRDTRGVRRLHHLQ